MYVSPTSVCPQPPNHRCSPSYSLSTTDTLPPILFLEWTVTTRITVSKPSLEDDAWFYYSHASLFHGITIFHLVTSLCSFSFLIKIEEENASGDILHFEIFYFFNSVYPEETIVDQSRRNLAFSRWLVKLNALANGQQIDNVVKISMW